MYHTSGRAPKVAGNTILHAVNNYWEENSGHAFEIDEGGMVIAEGNIFALVAAPVEEGYAGQLFSSPTAEDNAVCEAAMGRACEVNSLVESGAFDGLTSDFLVNLEGKTVANADPVGVVEAVKTSAGFGLI
ncbi:hypothetical protein IMZ48_02165 [Candidatus Bathyarchaeota archaeon]|nr:hypothetical protein [Candidatus Bathyarchaeota archaeon]